MDSLTLSVFENNESFLASSIFKSSIFRMFFVYKVIDLKGSPLSSLRLNAQTVCVNKRE